MAILSQPAFGPATALIYVTAGALLDVWTVVWYYAFARGQTLENRTWFWLVGLFLTGLTFMVLGILLGPIGRAARKSELPPSDATGAEAQIQQTAAATPQTGLPQAAAGMAPVAAPAAPVAAVVPPPTLPPAAPRNANTPGMPVGRV